jgi:hypothetical protein
MAAPKFNVDRVVAKYEKQILKKLQKEKATPSKYFDVYLTAGYEFLKHKEYKFAKRYYKKAIEVETKQSKTRPYSALVLIAIQENDLKTGNINYNDLLAYLKKNPEYRKHLLGNKMEYYKLILSGKKSKTALTKEELDRLAIDPTYAEGVHTHDLKIIVGNKDFKTALKMLDKEKFKNQSINRTIIYDLVSTMASAPTYNKDKLFCEKQYSLYPMSIATSYSMNICKILLSLKNKKKLEKKTYNRLVKLLKKKAPENMYLATSLSDLF